MLACGAHLPPPLGDDEDGPIVPQTDEYVLPDEIGEAVHIDLLFVKSEHYSENPSPHQEDAFSEEVIPPESVPALRWLIGNIEGHDLLTEQVEPALRWLVREMGQKRVVPELASGFHELARASTSYEETMNRYNRMQEARREKSKERRKLSQEQLKRIEKEDELKAALAEVKTEQERLRQKGREERIANKKAEKKWRTYRSRKSKADKRWKALSRKEKRARTRSKKAREREWKRRKEEERERKVRVKKERENNRHVRHHLKQREAELKQQLKETRGEKRRKESTKVAPVITTLVAILIVMDVKDRRILGLPVFESGKHVTAKEVVEALDHILPPCLKFLVSDNGKQFITEEMRDLMEVREGTHVRITPRHPKANSITERTVQTVKRMLQRYSWSNAPELSTIIEKALLDEYHDRPHQGLPNHFSPNAYDAFCQGKLVLFDA